MFADLMEFDHEESSSDPEMIVAPREFVQITASSKEVQCWISTFIEDNRRQININNVHDFCVPAEQRQHCARIDAVLVRRKGTTSHITVKDIKNYCGPDSFCPSPSSKSVVVQPTKRVFNIDDIESKLKQFNNKINSRYQQFPSTSSANYDQ